MTDENTSTNARQRTGHGESFQHRFVTEIRCLNSLEKNRETLEAFVAAAIDRRGLIG